MLALSLASWVEVVIAVSLIAMANLYTDKHGPKEAWSLMEDGSRIKIMISNRRDACPVICQVEHPHYTHKIDWQCESDFCNHKTYIKAIEIKKPKGRSD